MFASVQLQLNITCPLPFKKHLLQLKAKTNTCQDALSYCMNATIQSNCLKHSMSHGQFSLICLMQAEQTLHVPTKTTVYRRTGNTEYKGIHNLTIN